MNRIILCLVATLVLTGCASTPSVLYSPFGYWGEEYCETLDQCVVHTKTGPTHFSLSSTTVVSLSFVHGGGDASHTYYDYLMSIRNIDNSTTVYFDPHRITGYDPEAELYDAKNVQGIGFILLGTSIGTGVATGDFSAAVESAQLIDMGAERESELRLRFAQERIDAQHLAPGDEAAGRIIIKSSDPFADELRVIIPIAGDTHVFEFVKQE